MYESNAKVQLLTALANHELDEIISCADMILSQGYTTEQYEEFLDALSYIPDPSISLRSVPDYSNG